MKTDKFKINTASLSTDQGDIVIDEFIPETEGRYPCVIMSHGFNSCAEELHDIARVLAENGIYALCYDFNGGGNKGRSTGKTTDMSVLTEQNDLMAVLEYVKSLPLTGEIYLYGESQGGFVSAITAPDIPDIAGLFLVYPAFVIPHDWLSRDESTMQGEFEFMGVKISKTYYDGIPRYDVFAKASEFKMPVKIWHGGADPVVDPEYSLKLVKTYEQCELKVISGLGHWFPPEQREVIAEEIVRSIKA
ncbi:alpha/beta hydrolase [uncultured Ruminococcus sp.]|uniref:alpha/beta hydrolase family protein n=1 Tax=uncultured Ruminococcus sp. TaxID=165186 RepID=UPI0025E7C776|nr:alpha/beta hydrolase [uncultured Ruminococcus sp.]